MSDTKMNPEVKAKWLEALRSGRYQQTTGTLHRIAEYDGAPVGYCCLGVLCDLAAEEIELPRRIDTDHLREVFGDYGDYGEASVTPPLVQEWAGLASCNPTILDTLGDEAEISLAELNDAGKTFAEIADIIEQHL